ncbi:MAG: carboxypeptidase regulatory-like domain-containing protein [Gemmatimonadetes bacterium]|nr:carboxypeptidase regulatory-like domain-containing protein [Gemmatimonadota bacterium]
MLGANLDLMGAVTRMVLAGPGCHSRMLLAAAAAAVLSFSTGTEAFGQRATGTIEGTVRRLDDGAPLPFALVRLRAPGDEDLGAPGVLTDSGGRYRFLRVEPGAFQLQLELIGYERVHSPVLRVESGATLTHDLTSAFEPIRITGIIVRPEGSCVTADLLHEDEELAGLWNEARKGIEARRAFDLQYRYATILEQDVYVRLRLMRDRLDMRVDTIINQPDSVLVREERRHARQRDHGYGVRGALALTLPNERDLLADEFLQDHCLAAPVVGEDGSIGVVFRPVRPSADRVDIRGTIWLAPVSFQIRRLTLDWVEGERSIARGTIVYEDVPVLGHTLRLPVHGQLDGRMSGPMRAVVLGASAPVRFSYRAFELWGRR